MRRFLQHVLPKNFTKVRYYGLFSPIRKKILSVVLLLLNKDTSVKKRVNKQNKPNQTELAEPKETIICPCKEGILISIENIKPSKRDPPWGEC